MFKHWEQVRADLYATIEMFSDEELIYAPFDGSWPVGQIMLHIADNEDNWLHGVVRHEFNPWISYNLADYPNKAAIKDLLENARKRTVAFFENLDENDLEKVYTTPNGEAFSLDWIIWHVLEHEIHHRGELSLALGLLGCGGLDV
jgi:uncharacterized damage-inducible protein DinB